MTDKLPEDPAEAQDLKEFAELLFPVVLEQIKNESPNMDEETQQRIAKLGANRRAKSILATQPPKKPRSLEESVSALGARIAERAAEQKKQIATQPDRPKPPAKPAKIVEFPLLFETYTRAVSNPLARCSREICPP